MMRWKGTWKNQYLILTCHHKSTKESSCVIMHLQIVCVTDAYDHELAILSFFPIPYLFCCSADYLFP